MYIDISPSELMRLPGQWQLWRYFDELERSSFRMWRLSIYHGEIGVTCDPSCREYVINALADWRAARPPHHVGNFHREVLTFGGTLEHVPAAAA